MSEQARIAALQEKIRISRNVERTARLVGIAGAVFSGIGFSVYSFSYGGSVALSLGILGVIVLILGFVGVRVIRANTGNLMRELESIGQDSNVP